MQPGQPAASDGCNGDANCDGRVTPTFPAGACGGSALGECKPGVPTCESTGSFRCVGEVKPEAEVCDGKDNDCDGLADNDCTEPDYPGRGGGGGGLGGGGRGGGSCGPDTAGAPVSMTTGNMSFGPLQLVSLATPAGMPLRLAITYNSRNLLQGALGLGWTLNTEQRVTNAQSRPLYWSDLGTTSEFPLPPAAAFEDSALPNATLFTRSRGGANLGFYFASGGLMLCPQLPCPGSQAVAPRVVFEDGSTALFDAAGGFAGLRDLAGNEQRYFSPPPGFPTTTPGRTGLSQGTRSVALHRYSATRTDVVATVGAVETTVARVLVDGAGHLTDICAPAPPLPAASDTCRAAGMRTLFHFRYVAVGSGPMRLAEVTDEAGKTVERHQYQWAPGLGVLATTSVSATESLSFTFTPRSVPTRLLSVAVHSALAPASPPSGSQQVASVTDTRIVNGLVNRVESVGETCSCGTSTARTWGVEEVAEGQFAPRINALQQGLRSSVYSYGSSALDPYRFGRPTGERQRDQQPGVWGVSLERTLTYAYQHPLVRRPTITTEPGNSGVKVSVSDYDDDDLGHPCRVGVGARSPGSPTIPNEAPTRFLCRVADGSRVTHFRYDELGRLTRRDGPDGVPVKYEYWPEDDADKLRAGLLKSTTRGEGLLALTTSLERYHFTGRPTRIVNPNNEVTTYEFDLQGRMTRMVGPDNAVTLTEYAAGNKPAKVTLPSLVTIHSGYDAFGRLEDVTWRAPVALGAAVLQRQHRIFDLGGNVLLEQTYDASDTLTRQVQRDYDEAHRVTREYGLTTNVVKRFDYRKGVLSRSFDEAGRVSGFEYDGFGRLRRTLRLLGGGVVPAPPFTNFAYDVMDNLAEVIDANGNPTRYFHDDYGLTLAVTTPNSGTTTYSYLAEGALDSMQTETHRWANSDLHYTYDALRRPVGESHRVFGSTPAVCRPSLNGPPVCTPETFFIRSDTPLVTYGYDVGSHALGRLSSVTFSGGSRALSWDSAGRPLSESATLDGLSTTLPLVRTYHLGGALKSVAYPRQTSASSPPVLEYDKALDETISEVRFGGVALARDVTHYPFGGGVRSFGRGNGLTVSWSEDLLGRRIGSAGLPLNLGYDLDARGDVTLAREAGDRLRTRDYDYDAEHRLTSAVVNAGPGTATVFSERYSYDQVGNRQLKVRNGAKAYVSVFDMKAAPSGDVPANDLLRAVLDPPVAGLCVPVDGGLAGRPNEDGHGGKGDEDDDDEQGDDSVGRRHRPDAGDGCDEDERDEPGHRDGGGCEGGHGAGGGGGTDAGASADAGLPFCPVKTRKELAQLDAEWEAVMHEARKLVRDARSLDADTAHNRLLSVLEKLRAWMEKYDVPAPAMLAVLAVTKQGAVDFGTLLSAYLARRASGVAFGQEDLDLLERMVELGEEADMRQAVENDPTWRYTHDANGAVTSVTVEIPAFVLVPAGPGGPLQTPAVVSPQIWNTMCYRYDARQRMVQVEVLMRSGAQVSSLTPPCEDAARATMATFRYDEANRRVYANVAGKVAWEVRGSSGELLAEVSQAGEVERAYVYLDGEPLAMVALNPGKALRSLSTPLGCSSTGAVPGSLLALLVLALGQRRRAKQGAALTVLALTFIGCDTGGPQPGPTPPPGTSPGTVYYFHNDRLGTPVRLTNEAGATVWRADYRPFGDVQRLETDVDGDGVHIEQPLRFPGQYEDALSGLILAQGPYYNWNRHYEPATGRYFSTDPLLQDPSVVSWKAAQGTSMPTYAYASNNPITHTDPDARLDPGTTSAVVTTTTTFGAWGTAAAVGAGAAGYGIGYLICRATGNPYCDPRTWFRRSSQDTPECEWPGRRGRRTCLLITQGVSMCIYSCSDGSPLNVPRVPSPPGGVPLRPGPNGPGANDCAGIIVDN